MISITKRLCGQSTHNQRNLFKAQGSLRFHFYENWIDFVSQEFWLKSSNWSFVRQSILVAASAKTSEIKLREEWKENNRQEETEFRYKEIANLAKHRLDNQK